MSESTFEKIQRKTGRKPTECKCKLCKSQCKSVCLGTPEDIIKIIHAGYGERLSPTLWGAGVLMGLTNKPVDIVAPTFDEEKGCCTFFIDGLCELHEKGLKPTEGKLSHHSFNVDNFNANKSLSWNVVKEWINVSDEMSEQYKNLLNDRH